LITAAVVALVALTGAAAAAPEPKDADRQTPWKLYVDSKEAYAMKQELGSKALLVDVRDPVEIMFTGFAPAVDVVVPFMSPSKAKWNEKKSTYQVEKDPGFEAKIATALESRGLGKDAPVLLMCRSGGERGAPSAAELWGKGYAKVYVVVDGFEGETVKDGERKNWRLVNGWKNSGLPWGYALDKSKFPVGP
ncbi:MAG: rhodanese-like domain-containing protein, partial [Vicinamibacterales bacterium]